MVSYRPEVPSRLRSAEAGRLAISQSGPPRLGVPRSFFLLSTSAPIWGERRRGSHTSGSRAELMSPGRVSLAEGHPQLSSSSAHARTGVPVSTEEQQPTAGEIRTSALMEISNAMVHLYKQQFGRGPTSARTHWAGPDAVACFLENTLTPAE